MKSLISICFLSLFAIQIQAMHFELKNKEPFCMYRDVGEKEKVNISYLVSGKTESKIKMDIFYGQQKIYSVVNEKDHAYTLEGVNEGEYAICFMNIDG